MGDYKDDEEEASTINGPSRNSYGLIIGSAKQTPEVVV